jgi:hypothetical protein
MTIPLLDILLAMERGPDLRDTYGTCTTSPCACLRQGWRGRVCLYWQPMGPENQEQLAAWHRAASTRNAPPITTGETQEEAHAHR